MRQEMHSEVLLFEKGLILDDNESTYCFRGLEAVSEAGRTNRRLTSSRGRKAVLHEQNFQREEGYSDPRYIARVYIPQSEAALTIARARGLKDEMDAIL